MADSMTRAQAICACRNIIQLAEELDRAPEDMRDGIRVRAQSMEKSITEKPQFSTVTEKMDSALRNMWSGLKRWDRDEQFNDDLFADLDNVSAELADLDASAGNAAPKGRETGDKSDELAKKYGQGTQSGRFPADKPNVANTPKAQPAAPPAETQSEQPAPYTIVGPGTIALSDVLRRKEKAVGFVLDEIHNAALTVISKDAVRQMAVGDVLNLTKSDRTQQLIRAAYYVGVLRGVKLLHSKLQNGDE